MAEQSKNLWKWVVAAAALIIVVVVGRVVTAALWGGTPTGSPAPAAGRAPEADFVSVNTVRTRIDPKFEVVASNPGYVNAYYRVDLMAQVPGVVEKLVKDIGDRVMVGEEVLRLSVPELAAEVKVKDAAIADKRNELMVYESKKDLAAAAVESAKALVKEMQQSVVIAEADVEYRRTRAQRFAKLVSQEAAVPDVAAEMTAESKKAQATAAGAVESVARAQAEIAEASAKLEAARADIKLKQSEIEQAVAVRDKARAMLDFATLRAPFDGVVVRRNVDPGSFVSNSSSGHSDPLLTLERTDVLTVYSNFPDVYAPYISKGTDVLLEMSELPGVTIRGKVTRFAPTLQSPASDRTMRVEVDLYNGTAEEYRLFVKKVGPTHEGLKGGELPLLAEVSGAAGAPARLMPGMYGTMKLVLNQFTDAALLPSSAVFSRGGVRYVFLVKDGKAMRAPVDVQVENGKETKVLVIETKDGRESRRALRPDDEVVSSNQGELRDGQDVKTTPVEW